MYVSCPQIGGGADPPFLRPCEELQTTRHLRFGTNTSQNTQRDLPISTYAIVHAIWTHPPPFCAMEMYRRIDSPPLTPTPRCVRTNGRPQSVIRALPSNREICQGYSLLSLLGKIQGLMKFLQRHGTVVVLLLTTKSHTNRSHDHTTNSFSHM